MVLPVVLRAVPQLQSVGGAERKKERKEERKRTGRQEGKGKELEQEKERKMKDIEG